MLKDLVKKQVSGREAATPTAVASKVASSTDEAIAAAKAKKGKAGGSMMDMV